MSLREDIFNILLDGAMRDDNQTIRSAGTLNTVKQNQEEGKMIKNMLEKSARAMDENEHISGGKMKRTPARKMYNRTLKNCCHKCNSEMSDVYDMDLHDMSNERLLNELDYAEDDKSLIGEG